MSDVAVVALITWLITAGLGYTMFSIWLRGSANTPEGVLRDSHFRPATIGSHLLIAAGGLVLWLVYLVTDAGVIAWISFACLVLAAGLGDMLVLRWLRDRRVAPAARPDLAEQRIPLVAVAAHGAFAVATLVLVLVTAVKESL